MDWNGSLRSIREFLDAHNPFLSFQSLHSVTTKVISDRFIINFYPFFTKFRLRARSYPDFVVLLSSPCSHRHFVTWFAETLNYSFSLSSRWYGLWWEEFCRFMVALCWPTKHLHTLSVSFFRCRIFWKVMILLFIRSEARAVVWVLLRNNVCDFNRSCRNREASCDGRAYQNLNATPSYSGYVVPLQLLFTHSWSACISINHVISRSMISGRGQQSNQTWPGRHLTTDKNWPPCN